MLPETGNSAYGVIRTLVRDSTDPMTRIGTGTFLDSDNTISQTQASNRTTGDILTVRVGGFALGSSLAELLIGQYR